MSTMWEHVRKLLSSPNMHAAIFTVAVTGLSGGGVWLYNIGYNNGARDVADIRAFKDKLPSIIDDLDRVSKTVSLTAQMVDENKQLKERAEKDAGEIKRLRQQLQEQTTDLELRKKRVTELETKIAEVFPTSEMKITVERGSAQRPIPNVLTIAVDNVYYDSKLVDVSVNGRHTSMRVGDQSAYEFGDRRCKLELVRQMDQGAEFILACSPKN